jgi:hypothetical protein
MEENYEAAHMYFWFDGAGTITEISMFGGGTGSSDGTYQVAANGTITGSLEADRVMPFVGSMISASTAEIRVIDGLDTLPAMPATKVADPGALEGVWDGQFITGNGLVTTITITVNSSGVITNAVGLSGPFGGAMFTQGGLFAGMLTTGETNMWNQVMMRGTMSGETLSGPVRADGLGANAMGTLDLTRQTGVVMRGLSKSAPSAATGAALRVNQHTLAAPVVVKDSDTRTLRGQVLR